MERSWLGVAFVGAARRSHNHNEQSEFGDREWWRRTATELAFVGELGGSWLGRLFTLNDSTHTTIRGVDAGFCAWASSHHSIRIKPVGRLRWPHSLWRRQMLSPEGMHRDTQGNSWSVGAGRWLGASSRQLAPNFQFTSKDDSLDRVPLAAFVMTMSGHRKRIRDAQRRVGL
jgi:hypothetical protein